MFESHGGKDGSLVDWSDKPDNGKAKNRMLGTLDKVQAEVVKYNNGIQDKDKISRIDISLNSCYSIQTLLHNKGFREKLENMLDNKIKLHITTGLETVPASAIISDGKNSMNAFKNGKSSLGKFILREKKDLSTKVKYGILKYKIKPDKKYEYELVEDFMLKKPKNTQNRNDSYGRKLK